MVEEETPNISHNTGTTAFPLALMVSIIFRWRSSANKLLFETPVVILSIIITLYESNYSKNHNALQYLILIFYYFMQITFIIVVVYCCLLLFHLDKNLFSANI